MTKERTMAISNILLFFWLVLPLLFSLFLLLPVLITVIIKNYPPQEQPAGYCFFIQYFGNGG